MRQRFKLTIGPLVIGGLALCGCDGDDGGGTQTTPIPTLTDTPTTTPSPTETRSATASTQTAAPSATCTPTPTKTPTSPNTIFFCGNGIRFPEEECDDGNNTGGDGCAANCTTERMVTFEFGPSEVVVQTVNSALPLTVRGNIDLRYGSPTNAHWLGSGDEFTSFAAGEIPVAARATDVHFDPILVPGIVCACVRGVPAKSCGGRPIIPGRTRVDTSGGCAHSGGECTSETCDGTPTGQDCSHDGASTCGSCQFVRGGEATVSDPICEDSVDGPCRFTHGDGVSLSGRIGCNGLTDIDYTITIDSSLPDGSNVTFERSGGPAPPGSAFLFSSTALATIPGDCGEDPSDPNKGRDGLPCTEDDPNQGMPATIPLTTGTARVVIKLANDANATIDCDQTCGAEPCRCAATGAPFSCEALLANPPSTRGARLASAFGTLGVPGTGDAAVLTVLSSTQ